MTHDAQPKASLFIDGRFVEGEGAVLPVLYPYTGEEIASLREASANQVAQACQAAARANWFDLPSTKLSKVKVRLR